jgi:PAS domain S-box-containing protein
MRDEDKTREQLLEELHSLRRQVERPAELPLPIERLPLAYILLDPEDRVLEWNPAAQRIFGYSREEALGQVALDLLVPPPACCQVREVIRRLQAGDMDAHSVNDNRTRDGRIITCAWVNTPLRDDAGNFAGVIALVQDVTEKKRAEEKVRRSEALLAEAERLAHLGSWERDVSRNVVTWSEELFRIFGLQPGEFGATYEAFLHRVHPEDRARVATAAARALQDHLPLEHSFRIVRPDGVERVVHARGHVDRDQSGNVVRLMGACQDVTEQRAAEERLRESEVRFQQLANNIDGYFWLNAPDDSRFYYLSPGFEKIKGQSCEYLYQHPESWTDVIHPEDRERVLAVVGMPLRGGPRQVEYRIVRPDGSVRWIRDRAFPVRDSGGEVYRVAGIGEDVTERKQAEQELREYYERVQALSHQLLTVREEERRHLARELHDEIGQLLTSLKFLLESGGQATGISEPGLAEAGSLLEEALRRVRELSFDLRPALLDHLGLLPALRALFERYTARTGVRVNFNHAGPARRFAPELETTAYRIVQEALTNVARHAGVGEVVVRAWVDADTLTVQVEDEGAGFDAAAVLAAGRSSGLPGMHERVRLLGGRLVIASTPGEGTQLLAELPLSDPGPRNLDGRGRVSPVW